MSKRILALAISFMTLVVLCGAPAASFAYDGNVIKKEETVYVITDSHGNQNDVIVSDQLCNEQKLKTITDETTLSDIENVKGDEKFKQKGHKLEWAANGKDIFYQGRTDEEVPVSINVTYTLDGQSISGPDLQGKSGDVVINVKFINNGKYNGNTVPFIVLTGLIVTDDSFTDVKVDHGKILDDGSKQIVAGIAAPGLAQTLDISEAELGFGDSIRISGKAKKFAVEDMMTIVTNSVFEDIDTDQFGDLDYDSQINQLDKGAKKLVSGSNDLYDGLSQLNEKAPELKQGTSKLNSGAQTIAQALNGLKIIVYDGIEVGGQQLPALSTVLTGLNTIINSIQPAETLESIDTSNIDNDISNLETIKSTLSNEAQKTQIDQAINDLAKVKNNSDKVISDNTKIDKYNSSIASLRTTADAIPYERTALDKAFGAYSKEGKTGSATADGAVTLAKGMSDLDSNAETLVKGVNDLDNGAEKLSDGIEKLYREGIKKIVDLYNDELKSTVNGLESMMDAGKGYKTFTKLPANMDGNVKFIYKTTISK